MDGGWGGRGGGWGKGESGGIFPGPNPVLVSRLVLHPTRYHTHNFIFILIVLYCTTYTYKDYIKKKH